VHYRRNKWVKNVKQLSVGTVGSVDCLNDLVVKFLPADPEVPGSIAGSTRFYEKQWVWIEVHSAL
jgi:hypothetical protein